MEKVNVAVLGATGIVGQAFAWMLSGHKLFDPVFLTTSSSRSGKLFGDEVTWVLPFQMPERIANQKIKALDFAELKKLGIKIVFSALPSDPARTIEPELRDMGFRIFSNASAMRYDEDVPILIPEINLESMNLIEKQGFPDKGFIITNANCSVTGLALALAPLKKYGITEVHVSTYQSISGAGYPGLSALEISGNVIPFIEDEEEKIANEIRKIFGPEINIFPQCLRIPTLFGHHETVWIKFRMSVTENDIIEAWRSFTFANIKTSSLPEFPVIYAHAEDHPQTKMSFYGDPPGMSVFVGRLKKQDNRFGFVLLVNNLVRGAAGGSIANAEVFLNKYRGVI